MPRKASRRRRDLILATALQTLKLSIPRPWSTEQFVHSVGEARGRPIRLMPYPLTTGDPTGFWLSYPTVDYIIVPESATGERLDAIIGHEVAHIVLGHEPLVASQAADALTPNTSTALVTRFLPRHGYEQAIEREAETLATRLIAYIEVHSGDSPGRSVTEHDRISDRLR